MDGSDVRYRAYRDRIESDLEERFAQQSADPGDRVREAAFYSLSAGGKRIRPVLCLAVNDMLGGDPGDALPFASAIEMIHTFSLIHDDLPGMDNDDYRRGKPTCHKAYGEGMAILAGDMLLNSAYEILFGACLHHPEAKYLRAAAAIAEATGIRGMIGGQATDLMSGHMALGIDALERMHSMKTGALIQAPVMAAASIAGAPEPVSASLGRYAASIGLAFQIRDDLLDIEGRTDEIGKTAGKDARDGKSTFVTLLGAGTAKTQLEAHAEKAFRELEAIAALGYDTGFLSDLTGYLLERKS